MLRYGHCSTVLYSSISHPMLHTNSSVVLGGRGLCSEASRLVPCSGTGTAAQSCTHPSHIPCCTKTAVLCGGGGGGIGLCSKASRLVPCSGILAAVLPCIPFLAQFPIACVSLHALRNGTSPWVRWLEDGRMLQVSRAGAESAAVLPRPSRKWERWESRKQLNTSCVAEGGPHLLPAHGKGPPVGRLHRESHPL